MSLAESFERKFLFGLGRHLWNIVGMSGFIAVLTGVILLANSTTIQTVKTKQDFVKSEKVINKAINRLEKLKEEELALIEKEIAPLTIEEIEQDLSLDGWTKKNRKKNPILYKKSQGLEEIKNYLLFDRNLTSQDKQILQEYLDFEKKYNKEDRLIYSKYINIKTSFNNKINKERIILDTTYEKYSDKIESNNALKISHRFVSPFVMAYGLGVIASASITSAVLAVERNTRRSN